MLPAIALALLLAAQSPPATPPAINSSPVQPSQSSTAPAGSTASDTTPLRKIGGGITQPRLVYKVDPLIPNAARKSKVSGITTINLIADAHGNPQNVHVIRSIADKVDKKHRAAALLLDQAAVDAVKQYRFDPAMEGNKPVAVELNIEVNFQIF